MDINLLKRAATAGLVAIALAGCGTKKAEGPVFATPEPLAAAKPDEFAYKYAIQVRDLEGLPETVSRNLSTVLSADIFTESLRQSLANDQMLAAKGIQAEYELTPTFIDLRTAPVSENVTAAQAIFEYRVVRTEDSTVVFSRRIKADFSSIADPAFNGGGMMDRTLRFIGFRKAEEKPASALSSGAAETRAPGPEQTAAREIHAARNAIALNIRQALRHMIATSPERIAAPQAVTPLAGSGMAAPAAPATAPDDSGIAMPDDSGATVPENPAEAAPDETVTPQAEDAEEVPDEEEPEDENLVDLGDNPLPPLAPDVDEPDQ